MSTCKFKGHYGSVTSQLTKIDDNRYRLQTESGFCRFGGFSDEHVAAGREGFSFVDPAGGPFISVGHPLKELHAELPDSRITKITTEDEGIILHV